jgi:phthalate 4,5-dioxygenase
MLSHDDVEFFCRVGKGTPVGEVYRRYWTPGLPAADLPYPGSPPVEFRLLGEDLVAFRDKEGNVGVLDRYCSHRGASLGVAAVEDCGLRCIYHGWLFAADGKIVETPNMPATSKFKDINKQGSYPAREAGGLIWIYMGPAGEEPPFPNYHFFDQPAESINVRETIINVNYLQVQEGSIDSSHVGVLHRPIDRPDPEPVPEVAGASGVVRFGGWVWETPPDGSATDNSPSLDLAPVFEVEDTDFGFQYAAIRNSIYGEDRRYVRVTAFVFPYIGYIPPRSSPAITVPVDDYTTASFSVSLPNFDPEGKLNPVLYGSTERPPLPPRGQRQLVVPPQDRQAMEEGRSFAGWVGVGLQDAAVHNSMGKMYDRHNEHLVSPADAAVVRFRHILRDEWRRIDSGQRVRYAFPTVPTEGIKAGSGIVPASQHWHELVPGNLEAEGAPAGSTQPA